MSWDRSISARLLDHAHTQLTYVAGHMSDDFSKMASRACESDKYAFEVGVQLGVAQGIVKAVADLLPPEEEFEDE
jgi:hypothetical protein